MELNFCRLLREVNVSVGNVKSKSIVYDVIIAESSNSPVPFEGIHDISILPWK